MHRPVRSRQVAAILVAMAVVGGCSGLRAATPQPTPTDFTGIVAELGKGGISVIDVVSGDAGCDNQRLARTAISFDASGLDQPALTRIYLYAFKDQAVYDELRPTIGTCARSYVTDPAAFSSVDAAPYVLAGPGPWATGFKNALRDGLSRAAAGG